MFPSPTRSTLFPYTTLFRSRTCRRTRPCSTIPHSSARRLLRPPLLRPRQSKGKPRSEEHTSELQSLRHIVCRLLLEKKNKKKINESIWLVACNQFART